MDFDKIFVENELQLKKRTALILVVTQSLLQITAHNQNSWPLKIWHEVPICTVSEQVKMDLKLNGKIDEQQTRNDKNNERWALKHWWPLCC